MVTFNQDFLVLANPEIRAIARLGDRADCGRRGWRQPSRRAAGLLLPAISSDSQSRPADIQPSMKEISAEERAACSPYLHRRPQIRRWPTLHLGLNPARDLPPTGG